MSTRLNVALLACVLLPGVAMAQGSPVAKAFKDNVAQEGKNLVAAAESMPADKYSFKPTPAQMSFGDIVIHLAGGNDVLCGTIGGVKAPTRTKIAATDSKEALVKRLRETFEFCNQALANLDDAKLSEMVTIFGRQVTRAAAMTITTGDFADHYSQAAIYLRLNGVLPPTAKKP